MKLSGKSGVLQMFDVRGITTITVIIPFSHHHGQGSRGGWIIHNTVGPPLSYDCHRYTRGLRLKDRSLCSDTPYPPPLNLGGRRTRVSWHSIPVLQKSVWHPPNPGVSGPKPPQGDTLKGPLVEAVASLGGLWFRKKTRRADLGVGHLRSTRAKPQALGRCPAGCWDSRDPVVSCWAAAPARAGCELASPRSCSCLLTSFSTPNPGTFSPAL